MGVGLALMHDAYVVLEHRNNDAIMYLRFLPVLLSKSKE